MRTYTVLMNVTLSIDEQLVTRARKKADALGKSLNQLIRDYLQKLAGGDDPEQSIQEFKHLSGRGHSRGWRFERNEIHERPYLLRHQCSRLLGRQGCTSEAATRPRSPGRAPAWGNRRCVAPGAARVFRHHHAETAR